MRLDITEILREVGKVVPYEVDEPPLVDEDIECTKPVKGDLLFNNAGGTLLISGEIETATALPCSRCSQYFERPTTLTIEEQFELKHTPGARTFQTLTVVEEDENPVAAKLFEGQIFDLTEMVRQYLVLDEPTQPLPPEDAEGRCTHCLLYPEDVLKALLPPEEDAVETEDEKPINPAFAKLKDLLEEK